MELLFMFEFLQLLMFEFVKCMDHKTTTICNNTSLKSTIKLSSNDKSLFEI